MHFDDPAFWRAGAISTIAVMSIVLIMLTIDTAMTTPVTSAQVAKAWERPDRRLAAVSWSRRRGKTLASWS